MKTRQYSVLMILTVISGLVGGAVSNWFFNGRAAVAEEVVESSLSPDKVVEAEGFRLVDQNGKTLALFGKPERKSAGLWVYDGQGNTSIGIILNGIPRLEIHTESDPLHYLATLADNNGILTLGIIGRLSPLERVSVPGPLREIDEAGNKLSR